jgi:Bacterial nucleoid DNA-binding protein
MAAAAKSKSGMTQLNIQRGFELILKSTLEALAKGEKITIANFGTFFVKEMNERNARNPATGEVIVVAPKKVVKFKVTDSFAFEE